MNILTLISLPHAKHAKAIGEKSLGIVRRKKKQTAKEHKNNIQNGKRNVSLHDIHIVLYSQ